MFTGIVEETGTIQIVERTAAGARLGIAAPSVLADASIGDSIAVNGVCLTVVELGDGEFLVDVIPETLERTNLGALTPDSRVNLERPMRADGRFDGHIVQGHVDGTGQVAEWAESEDGGVRLAVQVDPQLLRYVVEKGSITIDGVSLTVAGVAVDRFAVALIPHTLGVTNLGRLAVGDTVNLEVDVVAKYVERLVESHRP